MALQTRTIPLLSTLLAFSLLVVATSPAAGQWRPFRFGAKAEPGTAEWWSKAQSEAIHEPGKGYRVPGVEGYFDGDGRRMNAPVDEVVASIRVRDEAPGGILPGLDPKRNYQRVRNAVTGGPNQDAATQALAEGHELYNQQRYRAAINAFELAAELGVGSRIEEEALFFIAESHFRTDRYVDARDGYNRLVSKFPSTTKLDTLVNRQWEIAKYWKKYAEYRPERTLQPNLFDKTRPTFDTIGQAVRTYDSIRLNDPTGPRADDAVMETANIYFAQERYEDADYHYTLLRQDYPRSELQFEAHLLGLQTKLRMYQGPDYDGTPLEDAKKLARRIRTNFAGRLSPEEKERLRLVDANVQQAVEERDLKLASYYDNVEQYGAARQLYAQIVRDHGESPVGQQAATRLAELGGLPDTPEKPLSSFVALFPQNRERARFAQVPEVRAAREAATRLANNPGSTNNGVVPATATEPAPTVQR